MLTLRAHSAYQINGILTQVFATYAILQCLCALPVMAVIFAHNATHLTEHFI